MDGKTLDWMAERVKKGKALRELITGLKSNLAILEKYELTDAEKIFRQMYERDNNATALGLAEYLIFMIEQRRVMA